MTLSLRRTGLASPAFAHKADYVVIEDGRVIGRVYEDRYLPADIRWFWSITEYVHPALGIPTHDRVASLDSKEQFKSSWSKVRAAMEQRAPI
jgi:hypothetical protein